MPNSKTKAKTTTPLLDEEPKVSANHKAFVEHFLRSRDHANAYRSAGYRVKDDPSAIAGAYRLMARDDVQNYLQWAEKRDLRQHYTNISHQHQVFVEEWLRDFNVVRAHRAAGYVASSEAAARSAGCQILSRPDVQQFLLEVREDDSRALGIDRHKIVKALKDVAFSNILDLLMNIQGDTITLEELKKLPRQIGYTISSITQERNTRTGEVRLTIKMKDSVAALKVLAKYYGVDLNYNELLARIHALGYEVKDSFAEFVGAGAEEEN